MDGSYDARPFLDLFAERYRGHVFNHFLNAARGGAAHSAAVLVEVERVARERLARAEERSDGEAVDKLTFLLTALREHGSEARLEAARAVWYCALPDSERSALKRQQAERGRRAWMSAQPPSPKQVSYLRALGHTGPVASKAEASELIDQLRGVAS